MKEATRSVTTFLNESLSATVQNALTFLLILNANLIAFS